MHPSPSPQRTRDLAFLISGLMDVIIGALFLLAWFNLLPFDLISLGIPRWLCGVLGVVFSLTGVSVVTHQLTKLREPD